jgi:hypothetical protein
VEKEVYLGDGLYASFDGFSFNLRTPREGGDHWVALEPAVFDALIEFRAKIIETMKRGGAQW